MKFRHLEAVRSLAVVGATGLVGEEFLSILSEHKIKIPKIRLLASQESAGETLEVNGAQVPVEELDEKSFKGIEVAFFSVPSQITEKYVPKAIAEGALVLDDSAVYRMDPEVALVVPEVNGSVLRNFTGKVIATPNCTTTPLVLALKPLLDQFGIERVVTSTYQSVSGAGRAANDELSRQVIQLMNATTVDEPQAFPRQIAFNCLPMVGEVTDSGESTEEVKMVKETRKILAMDKLRINATTVRVPTFCGHGLSVNVELSRSFDSIDQIREILDGHPGLKVVDQPGSHVYPVNLDCPGTDAVLVGRIRRDFSVKSGLSFWVITDNVRKGAALNALQSLETLYHYRSMS